MTDEKKLPSVPTDYFTSSYQHLVDENYLFPLGNGSKQPGTLNPNSGTGSLQSYSEEVSL